MMVNTTEQGGATGMPVVIGITHHDWRTDETAMSRPWGVTVDGTERERSADIGAAGDWARWHAGRIERDGGTAVIDWQIRQVA